MISLERMAKRWGFASDIEGLAALEEALSTGSDSWWNYLARSPHRDGISLLYRCENPRLRARLYPQLGLANTDWLYSRPDTQLRRRAEHIFDPVEKVLFETRSFIRDRISFQLQKIASALPSKGYILHLTEYLRWCFVIKYDRSGNAVNLTVQHVIDEPRALYDIFDLVHNSREEMRTMMRSVLRSKAKLVSHRGVLVHVDRYTEESVFGPSIDTIYLHEILCYLLYEGDGINSLEIKAAMEPGCGNGFLSAALVSHITKLERLVVVDSQMESIICTKRNLAGPSAESRAKVHAIEGSFDPHLLRTKFDLIVVNPPYLPDQPSHRHDARRQNVGGTDFLQLLVRSAAEMLTPDGAMIMIFSTLANPEFDAAVSETSLQLIELGPVGGFEVLFDLEAVVEDPEWRSYLEERGLHHDRTASSHSIRIVALIHQDAVRTAGAGSAVAQIARFQRVLQAR